MRNKIVLSGMEFYGRHGVHPEEAVLGARFVVDCEMRLADGAMPDRLDATVDYAAVYESIYQEVTRERFDLIEALAGRIADRLLREQPLLEAVLVRVHKPHAPIPGIFRDVYAEVEISRTPAGPL
jgi:dihydroneopterin aldolase